jgi:hypothetical protein
MGLAFNEKGRPKPPLEILQYGPPDQATVALTILPGARGGSPLGMAWTCSMPLIT